MVRRGIALLLVLALAGAAATAQSADGGGPVVSGLATPLGGVWAGTHWWQSVAGSGLCRVDGHALNPATCVTDAATPGQIALDPRTNADGTRFVYVPDRHSSRSLGVHRYTWHPDTEMLDSHLLLINTGLVQQRLHGIAVGADGSLYVSSLRSDRIWRITNPDRDRAQQTAYVVGVTRSGGGAPGGLAVINHPPDSSGRVRSDLYVAEAAGVSVITDVATCRMGFICFPESVPVAVIQPQAIAADGRDYLYLGQTPPPRTGPVVRYNVWTHTQDVYSDAHPAITLADGSSLTRYLGITGLGVRPDNGDLYVATDWSTVETVPGGDLWVIPGGAAPDVAGTPGHPAYETAAAGPAQGRLLAWGLTAPDGGVVRLPGAQGGHWWVADHTQGFCRLDPVPGAQLLAINADVCDDETMGSPGAAVYDPLVNRGIAGVPDGTHFVYLAQNDHLSPGIWRFVFDPATESLLPGPALMAPGQLTGVRISAVALGPDGNLYAAGVRSDKVFRINNPGANPRFQTVDVVAVTYTGRGPAGTFGFVDGDLYVPEDTHVSVVRGAASCPRVVTPAGPAAPAVTQPCTAAVLPVPVVGATGLAVDPVRRAIYIADAPGAVPAVIWRWDVSRQAADVYTSVARLPNAGTPEARIWCSLTCSRTANRGEAPGALVYYRSVLGLAVDPQSGTLFVADDPSQGARGARGHLYAVDGRGTL